ncbi:MFS transporter [Radiobacillus kanasensis]|uniref:MFS transporter n=1 Tax=Radiobacillus kanasensis TaxID=2844358 RepID=UPI001E51A812|nr:MFS transporter [Radiobacillus kanasensis]UFU00498.1 MFS transporter [Radiobacillus kanasensis]
MSTVDIMPDKDKSVAPNVFKNRNYLFLLIGAFFSAPGYYVYLIGAEWLMLSITDDRFFFGMLFFAASVPRLLLLTSGGVIADRFNKRTVLFLSDMSRAVLLLLLIILVWTDTIAVWHLIAMAVLFGISDAFSHPAMNSLTPTLLEDEQLQRGNSLMQMAQQISPILGPALGGSMIFLLGFKGVFIVSFIMLFLASLTVLQIKIKETVEKSTKKPLEELKEGFMYMKQNKLLLHIMIMALFINFFFSGPLSIGLPIIVKDIFESNALGLTILECALGVGALSGAIVLASRKNLKRPGVVLLQCTFGLGLLYILTGASFNLIASACFVAIMGFMTQLVNIPLVTMLQQSTEKKMLGRVMSVLMTVSTGLIPVSYAVTSSLIAMGMNIQIIIATGGAMVMLIALANSRNKLILGYQFAKREKQEEASA